MVWPRKRLRAKSRSLRLERRELNASDPRCRFFALQRYAKAPEGDATVVCGKNPEPKNFNEPGNVNWVRHKEQS